MQETPQNPVQETVNQQLLNRSEKIIANATIVREAVENDCTAIAFENLKHIRKHISNASKSQQWAFRELQRHVEYKAEECGIDVDDVTPAYTSQRCSHGECGFTHEDNRNGDEFECQTIDFDRLPFAVRVGAH